MKLVVMIPCFNEEATLPLVLETIPRAIAGIDSIDILVIDDGSTDRTV
jgi:glycosyltransferase involved in cell wall biosynthesis